MADFLKLRSIEEYKNEIASKLADLDVAIVVLNAGYVIGGLFNELSDEEVERHMQINGCHVMYGAKALIGQLVQRFDEKKKKSALIIVSSIMSVLPLSGVTSYCATKIFASYVGEALNMEYKDKVDVMSYQPGGVATKMIDKAEQKKGTMDVIMPEMSATTCFRDLGIEQMTRGAFRHEYSAWFLGMLPRKMIQ